jgi:polyphosphate kinase 2
MPERIPRDATILALNPDDKPGDIGSSESKLKKKAYETELARLQLELVKMEDWVRAKGLRVVVLFEGRDAAGKGGVIKRIMDGVNPRICRVVALAAPNERERGQWYFQRYVAQLPTAGEIVLFDRSWYNRAGVERVMGFATAEEVDEFMRATPDFERMLIRSGTILIKYWFSVSDDEQPIPGADQRSRQELEAQPDGPRGSLALGRVLESEGRHVPSHRHGRLAMVGRRIGRQAARASQLHLASPPPGAVRGPAGAAA